MTNLNPKVAGAFLVSSLRNGLKFSLLLRTITASSFKWSFSFTAGVVTPSLAHSSGNLPDLGMATLLMHNLADFL